MIVCRTAVAAFLALLVTNKQAVEAGGTPGVYFKPPGTRTAV